MWKLFNILLTVIMCVAYFGFDNQIMSYGSLLILVLISEICDLFNSKD